MDENNEIDNVPESPRPLAFTVDFGDGKQIDTQRHKSLVEKFQKKHRRGQSLSKIDEPPPGSSSSSSSATATTTKKHPSTGNLPRKSGFQSDGYVSSDEKTSTNNSSNNINKNKNAKRSELSLTLKNTFSDKMSHSFPNAGCVFNLETPVIELKDVSSPELDLISPFSPRDNELPNNNRIQQQSTPINGNYTNNTRLDDEQFVDGTEFDFDKKSDTISDTGTYTLDADNYSEEQKARMSIDNEFKIEQVSVMKKTEEYIKSLCELKEDDEHVKKSDVLTVVKQHKNKLSPILSPTQNLSITESLDKQQQESDLNKTFTRIIFPSPKAKNNGLDQLVDQGSVISVTSSGAFRTTNQTNGNCQDNRRKKSLTQSEIHVETYIGEQSSPNQLIKNKKLTTNIINVQSISVKHDSDDDLNKIDLPSKPPLPPASTQSNGKLTPTKIPSPIHTITRPRSRNSLNIDLSDSSLETESYLKSTQNCINQLKQRLSLDSDNDDDNDVDNKKLNNLLNKQKMAHIRHNSLDDKISNKLEHFHLKNLQTIDQTTNVFNQYNQQQQLMQKIQNSPNNSPIRRSSSFSTKNLGMKNTNLSSGQLPPHHHHHQQQQQQKETNLRNSPNLSRTTSTSIHRSASTANIKPNYLLRRSSINTDQLQQYQHHSRIDRNQFGDTDTSSEEDYDKQLTKKKDLSLLTNTRYNRAFSLRRGRLDDTQTTTTTTVQKCPNTPEMRRKFVTEARAERAISVDRKPVKTSEIQSRYLLNIAKKPTTPSPIKNDLKIVPKTTPIGGGGSSSNSSNLTKTTPKNQVFSRTDSGRFSTRSGKPPSGGPVKGTKKDQGKKSGGRSNSSLSSREKEFQNWKRRKSYDPMKAAAEGKRKELAKKQNNIMTQSYNPEANQNQDCDSSPSHSSSVHRSQSFHGTAALEQLISSEEEEDLTLSADEGFSPPTPSPCELSPARAILRNAWKDHILH